MIKHFPYMLEIILDSQLLVYIEFYNSNEQPQ